MTLLHHCVGILFHSSLQSGSNSVTLDDFPSQDATVSQSESSQDFDSAFILLFLRHSEVDLSVFFRSLSGYMVKLDLQRGKKVFCASSPT